MASTSNLASSAEIEEHAIDILPIEPSLWHEACCIFMVPENLRNVNEKAYTPQLISIGPIHHDLQKLKPMEKEKKRYYDLFKKRLGSTQDLEEFKEFLSQNEQAIRHCYPEHCYLKNVLQKEFIKMILLDAVFIMELFLRNSEITDEKEKKKKKKKSIDEKEKKKKSIEEKKKKKKSIDEKEKIDENDYLFAKTWLKDGIMQDLLLLENQLPFFVLQRLGGDVAKIDKAKLLSLTNKYFGYNNNNISDFKHFTDLIRCHYIPPQLTNKNGCQCATEEPKRQHLNKTGSHCATEEPKQPLLDKNVCQPKWQLLDNIVGQFKTKLTKPIPNCNNCHHDNCDDDIRVSATKLNEAGVSFRRHARSNQARTVLDITFKKKPLLKWFSWLSCLSCFKWTKAYFEFPQLIVDDGTECIFRNLMAFEQWQYPNETYVCNYCFFLDSLIDTTEDADLLVENKVIVNGLGSNEDLRDLFNNLCKQVVITTQNDCYRALVQELLAHYNDRWNRTMATLKSVYFCDLWRGSSTVVGIAVLILTVTSSFRSIF